MDIFVWNKNADKTCVKTGSYCALSEDLVQLLQSNKHKQKQQHYEN